MTIKRRSLVGVISARLKEKAPLIQVVVGPRQVGKTTALKTVLGKTGVLQSADYPIPLPSTVIEEWWNQALSGPDKILAIDEIQKIPGWSEILKRLWDANPKILKVVVTGSSALMVEKGLKETLAGRFELIRAEHWNFQEAQKIFGLTPEDFIEFGCYPGSVEFLSSSIERWGAYIRDSIVEPALGRDLLQLHPVNQPALLRQLFGVAISMPGQIVSLQKLQGQLQGKGTLPTLQNYLKLLSNAFLVTGIEKYSPVPIRSKKSSPKLIVHDNALIRAFERSIAKSLNAEQRGRYFENCVGARLIESGWETFYWKDRDQEVDFVVLGPNNEKWAIEVKSSFASEKEFKGLRTFVEQYPDFEPILLSLVGQSVTGLRSLKAEEVLAYARKY